MKTGFIVGKFAPLTTGHINFINQSSTKCDKLLVILSYDEKWRQDKSAFMSEKLSLKNRLKWLKETYSDIDHIVVDFVDESDIPPYPHGWKMFAELVKTKLSEHFGCYHTDYVFSSEPDYDEGFKTNFPSTEHVIIDSDRSRFPICATDVRSDIFKNWDYLPSAVRKEFVYKVCIIGTESTGKTTLTKYLAKMFATSWVEEYGRVFCEKDLHGDESLLDYEDYAKIAFRHKEMEEESARTANRVLISDTNALVTGFYQQLYEGSIDPIVDGIIRRERYDLVLFAQDDVPWVADGLRMNGSENQRTNTRKLMYDLLDYYGIDYVRLFGGYEERLNTAYRLIKISMECVK